MPKPVLSDLAWRSRLQDYANGLFKFGTGQHPPKASKWHQELEKIEKCPRPRKTSSAVVKDLFGNPVMCTCGYHNTSEYQPQSQMLRPSPGCQQEVPIETVYYRPSDTRETAASCVSELRCVPLPSLSSTSRPTVTSEEPCEQVSSAVSEQVSPAVAPACSPSVKVSFVSTQTSSGIGTCPSTSTTSGALGKVRAIQRSGEFFSYQEKRNSLYLEVYMTKEFP